MASKNEYSWNVLLKFSWGHIIALVALIIISYVTFMGNSYLNGGDFKNSILHTMLIDAALLITFVGAQMCKGTAVKFEKFIVIERILILLSPVAFVWAMMPFNHFWTVFGNRASLEQRFGNAIVYSKQMFDDYDAYANMRISTYDKALEKAIADKTFPKYSHEECSFAPPYMQKNGFHKTLDLQLLSENTRVLKKEAVKWIDEASLGASVWNAFLMGNAKEIKSAIDKWDNTLIEYSKPTISNEQACGGNVTSFAGSGDAVDKTKNELDELTKLYTEKGNVNVNTVWTGAILWLCLLVPYLIQPRNTKARGYYHLLPIMPQKSRVYKKSADDDDDIDEDDEDSDNDDLFSGTITWK